MRSKFKYQFPFPRYPAVRIFIVLATGIALARLAELSITTSFLITISVLMLYIVLSYLHRKTLLHRYYTGLISVYLFLLIAFGFSWAQYHGKADVPSTAQKLNDLYNWEEIYIAGGVTNAKVSNSGNAIFDIQLDTIWISGIPQGVDGFRMRLYGDSMMVDSVSIIHHLRALVRLYPLEDIRNPHEFDYKNYLAEKGIYLHGRLEAVEAKQVKQGQSWHKIRSGVKKLIDRIFSRPNQSLAYALLLGDKTAITPDTRQDFSRSGLSHIMAVSGLHVGFIVAPFWLIIPYIRRNKAGKWVALVCLGLVLLGYAGITGFSASVMRASIMALLLAYSTLWHKASDALNVMAAAGIIILLVDPAQLFDVGFQLSFVAVTVILLILPVLYQGLPDWVRFRWYGQPLTIMLVSAVVQLGLAPLLIFYFGEFSLIGPLVNAVIIPFLGVVLVGAIGNLIIATGFPVFAQMLNVPVDGFLTFLQWITAWVSGIPGAWMQIAIENGFIFVIWALIIGWLAALPLSQVRWKWTIVLLAGLVIYQGSLLAGKIFPDPLKVVFFDVGQGDAALISTPDDHHILIDTGIWRPDFSSGTSVLLPYLEKEHITRLDAVYLSHPHADHIGGIEALMEAVPIDTIFNAGMPYTSDLYHRYRRKAQSKNIPVKAVRSGILHRYGDLLIYLYGPHVHKGVEDVNEYSVVMEAVYGQTEFLFMGDAGKEQEHIVRRLYGHLIDTDVLKVGHHGSKTSSGSQFLSTATPEWSIISLGWENRYGHPHPEAMRRIHQAGGTVLYTSLNGAVVLESDGKSIWQKKWR